MFIGLRFSFFISIWICPIIAKNRQTVRFRFWPYSVRKSNFGHSFSFDQKFTELSTKFSAFVIVVWLGRLRQPVNAIYLTYNWQNSLRQRSPSKSKLNQNKKSNTETISDSIKSNIYALFRKKFFFKNVLRFNFISHEEGSY